MNDIQDLLPDTRQFREAFRTAAYRHGVVIKESKTSSWTGGAAFFPDELHRAFYRSWNNRRFMRQVTFKVYLDDDVDIKKMTDVMNDVIVWLTLSGKIPYTKLSKQGSIWKITGVCAMLM